MNLFCRVTPRSALALLATVFIAAAFFLTGPASVRAAGLPCQSTALSQASLAGSCWVPFSAGSAFNTRLSATPPVASDNLAVQQHIASYGWTFGESANGFSIGAGDGSRPVFYATPSSPVMTIHCTSSEGPGTCQGLNGVDINGARINVPAGARPASNWDAHLTIIETATGAEYDFWHASISGSTITSGTGAETNVNTGNGTGGGGDAANLSLSAGLLRPAELMAGQIDHALVAVVPCTNATGANVGYTWPATGGWGEACGKYWNEQAGSAPELGQLMRLNMSAAQIASSGAPQWEQTIMTALANYGAYIEDTDGSWHNEGIYILTEAPASWTAVGQPNQWAAAAHAFGQRGDNLESNVSIPANRLEFVNTCVTRGTCPNSGGALASARSSARVRTLERRRHLRLRAADRRAARRRAAHHHAAHHRRRREYFGAMIGRRRAAVSRRG